MPGDAVHLDAGQRSLVLAAIEQHCLHRQWILYAAHVRTNHAHAALWADVAPERAMVQLKLRASRALNASGGSAPRWWARHGSTRYLWRLEQIPAAVDYVINGQGEPMSLYPNPKRK
ncbi:MAG: hypothetical protein O3A53_06005 [Acidobacteria bacterium]|nr:hypothetical protein [Acidobacteriota bacterium]MDA1234335.1 hypothetical protein [Acidobacteriota bacterium]